MNHHNAFHIWRKHSTKIIFGLLFISSLAISHSDIKQNMRSLSIARQEIATNNTSIALLEQQLNHEKAQAAIAEARYRQGCTIVVAARNTRNLATLVQGETVLDRTTKKSLPLGTVVCDANGNTGVMVAASDGTPVVGRMAFTGNRELALQQIRRIRGAKVYYVTPEK